MNAGRTETTRPGGDAPTGLDAVLRDLVDGMAHQLRNSLQAVAVNVEVLRVQAGGGRSAKGRPGDAERFATAAEETVRLLDRRLRLLVLVSRAAGEEPAVVQPLEVVDDLVGALRLGRGDTRVSVSREVAAPASGGPPARVRAGHFVACLARLLELARSRAGGPVEVRAAMRRGGPVLEARFPVAARARRTAGDRARAEAPTKWEEVARLARAAGAEVEREEEAEAGVFRLLLPGA